MSESKGTGRKILTYGCAGCGGLLLLFVIAIGAMFAVAKMQLDNAEPVAHTEPMEIRRVSTGEAIELTETVGRLSLDLSGAGFLIRPGDPGTPLLVEAEYDRKGYELIQRFEEASGDAPPTYRIEFRPTSSGFMRLIRGILGAKEPVVTVRIPPDAPLDLELLLAQGGMEAELGGLWLRNVDFEIDKGGAEIEVSRPLRAPVERMRLEIAMGGGGFRDLGNASPRLLEVSMSMGGADLDLTGAWTTDSTIRIDARMAGGAVTVPAGVRVEGLADLPSMADAMGLSGAEPEVPPPTLRFELDIKEDDWRFERRK